MTLLATRSWPSDVFRGVTADGSVYKTNFWDYPIPAGTYDAFYPAFNPFRVLPDAVGHWLRYHPRRGSAGAESKSCISEPMAWSIKIATSPGNL